MTFRPHISLDGTWRFWVDRHASLSVGLLPAGESIDVTVPAPWQSQSDDLRFYSGRAWYRRTVEIPSDWLQQRVILGFGAVDYLAEVWVNDRLAGTHHGGYLPFEFDITDLVQPGENSITVCVDDPPGLFPEIPHGKQSWYGPLSGIWQSVWIEQRSPLHLRRPRVWPELQSGQVGLAVSLSERAGDGWHVLVEVVAPDGETIASERVEVPAGVEVLEHTLQVAGTLPWSPDSPNLYRLEASLQHDNEEVDRLVEHFGFRTIETRNGYLYLNGEMLFLRGALDQDYYPGTICTPPSVEFLEDQLRKAKEMGLNCLRCHIKVPDPRYYEVADRLGMLIWTELPNWRALTEDAAIFARDTMRGILERDGNHPSIIIWTFVNEDWGTELMHDPAHRAWLKESYQWLKALDPLRLVVDNSPCEGNFHVQTDIEDYHFYRAIPDHRLEWDYFVNEFAARLAPTFSPFGDAVRTGDEPLILSEFGNWGLPDVELLKDAAGQEPWWFETGQEWGGGVVYPHGIQQRFRRWGLGRVFESWQAFVEATQWQQFLSLKYEIESIRRHPQIVGYVITEFTDVHWECNGLLDMERNLKAFHPVLKQINADTMVIPEWHRTAYWSGEPVEVGVTVAHGAGPAIQDATVTWRLGDSEFAEQLDVQEQLPGTTQRVGLIRLQAPAVDAPTIEPLTCTLNSRAKEPLAVNNLPLAFFPQRLPTHISNIRLWVGEPVLASRLLELGYQLAPDTRTADAIVVTNLDYTHARYLRDGGRLLLLAQSEDAILGDFLDVQVQARKNTLWRGDWASSFAWLRREGPFARFPGGPLLDYSFSHVTPDYVLAGLRTGLGPWDFESDVYAGLFVGWIHKIAALVVKRQYGTGTAVLSSFRINPILLGPDPVTTLLLDALVELTFAGGANAR